MTRLVAFAAAVLLACAPVTGRAESSPPVEAGGRVSLAAGTVDFLGPEAEAWRTAETNLALQPGDRVRTGEESRAEVQFEGGAVVRLGAGSEAEILEVGRSPAVRLVGGRVYARGPRLADAALLVQAGERTVAAAGGSAFRVDLAAGHSRAAVAVSSGRVAVEGVGARVELDRGERLPAQGEVPEPASLVARDEFDRWNADRDAALARTVADPRYAPDHLPGLTDLDAYGSWVAVERYGWAWRPHVAVGWRPFVHGRWVHRPYYGWVWLAAEPWGWTPYHYGHWVASGLYGWIWVPGPVFVSITFGAPHVVPVALPPIVIRRPVVVHRPVVVVRPPVVVRRPVVVAPPAVVAPQPAPPRVRPFPVRTVQAPAPTRVAAPAPVRVVSPPHPPASREVPQVVARPHLRARPMPAGSAPVIAAPAPRPVIPSVRGAGGPAPLGAPGPAPRGAGGPAPSARPLPR